MNDRNETGGAFRSSGAHPLDHPHGLWRCPWILEAVTLHRDVLRAGLRVKRFRLTPEQARDLQHWTGQRKHLLGHPILVTEAPGVS